MQVDKTIETKGKPMDRAAVDKIKLDFTPTKPRKLRAKIRKLMIEDWVEENEERAEGTRRIRRAFSLLKEWDLDGYSCFLISDGISAAPDISNELGIINDLAFLGFGQRVRAEQYGKDHSEDDDFDLDHLECPAIDCLNDILLHGFNEERFHEALWILIEAHQSDG